MEVWCGVVGIVVSKAAVGRGGGERRWVGEGFKWISGLGIRD